jgi:hypothetical protein
MVSPVTSTPHIQGPAAVQPPAARPPRPPQPEPAVRPQPAATDTVKISVVAQALQEATESRAQTTKEAGSGDVQARRLLAQEAAAHATTK